MGLVPDLPLAQQTDIAVLALMGSVVDDCGDHLVVRTPQNPGFHFGNLLFVRDAGLVNDVDHWLARFTEVLPDAEHRAIELPAEPDKDAWAARKLEIDAATTLTRAPHETVSDAVDGYELTALPTSQDWIDLLPTGQLVDPPSLAFRGKQLAAQRRLARYGPAAWFGARTPDKVVAALGIVDLGNGQARYQNVMTDEAHRGRGLASWLLSAAGVWAGERGVRELVIVADADSAAEKLYERGGFSPIGTTWSAYAPPPPL